MTEKTEKCEFKSAEQLGLKQPEWEALIKTLTLMEAGAIIHATTDMKQAGKRVEGHLFNMSNWKDYYQCGTVCCIGGSAEVFGNLRHQSMDKASKRLYREGNLNLHNLFFNWEGSPSPKEAAVALRGYLTTGKTDWSFMLQ